MWLKFLKISKNILFYFYSEIQANSGEFRRNLPEFRRKCPEFRRNSPEFRRKCPKIRQKNFAWIQAKTLLPEFAWIFFIFSCSSLKKNGHFRTLSPTFRRFRLNSGRFSWNLLNSGNFLLKSPEYRRFQEKKE